MAAWGYTIPAVLAARACVGLGEGSALPVMNNLVATNISPKRRATALGSCFSGFHTGKFAQMWIEKKDRHETIHGFSHLRSRFEACCNLTRRNPRKMKLVNLQSIFMETSKIDGCSRKDVM